MKNKLLVIKIGGGIISDSKELEDLLKAFSKIQSPKILVHGGGKKLTEIASIFGHKAKFHEGRRITTDFDLELALMVYAGLINKSIVAKLQSLKCNSLGLTGADLNTVVSVKRSTKPIDFGLVGDVSKVNSDRIQSLLQQNIIPVFCAISYDGKGQLLNTNADTMSTQIALAMSNFYDVDLKFCFEKMGVMTNVENENSLIRTINLVDFDQLRDVGLIKDGMIPKLVNGFEAKTAGVGSVSIGKYDELMKEDGNYTKLV